MPYLWITNKSQIQLHLSTQSTIVISASPTNPQDYSEALAMSWENYAVRYIVEWLAMGWEITTADTPTDELTDMAARLTAALIGIDKLTVQFGSAGPSSWASMYLLDVHTRVMSLFLSHDVIELGLAIAKKRLTYEQRFSFAMSRKPRFLIDMLQRA